jgi:hypothetical protein
MAPEFPPRLVVLDLLLVQGVLVGRIEYVEGGNEHERLTVLWKVDGTPNGFFPAGHGVASVKQSAGVFALTAAEQSEIPSLGNGRWVWPQELPHAQSWLMVIMILPAGHTLAEATPAPVRAKEFRERLAVYYIAKADEPGGRISIEWSLAPATSAIRDELSTLNRRCAATATEADAGVDIWLGLAPADQGPELPLPAGPPADALSTENAQNKAPPTYVGFVSDAGPGAKTPEYRFDVAISFAGDNKRATVRAVAELLQLQLGVGKVFFDEWFEAELAGHDAQAVLQNIYRRSTRLVVTCVCQRYAEKSWTQEEWRAICAFERGLRDAGDENIKRMRFLPLRFGDGEVDGIFETAIVPDVRGRSPEGVAALILERLRLAISAPTLSTNPAVRGRRSPPVPSTSAPPTRPLRPSANEESSKSGVSSNVDASRAFIGSGRPDDAKVTGWGTADGNVQQRPEPPAPPPIRPPRSPSSFEELLAFTREATTVEINQRVGGKYVRSLYVPRTREEDWLRVRHGTRGESLDRLADIQTEIDRAASAAKRENLRLLYKVHLGVQVLPDILSEHRKQLARGMTQPEDLAKIAAPIDLKVESVNWNGLLEQFSSYREVARYIEEQVEVARRYGSRLLAHATSKDRQDDIAVANEVRRLVLGSRRLAFGSCSFCHQYTSSASRTGLVHPCAAGYHDRRTAAPHGSLSPAPP